MTDRGLRDHLKPCDHSEFYRFKVGYPELWCCRVDDCPGGQEVTREALIELVDDFDTICDEIWELGQASWPWRDAATPVLDAALSDGEV